MLRCRKADFCGAVGMGKAETTQEFLVDLSTWFVFCTDGRIC
jgi:hypothetical protein